MDANIVPIGSLKEAMAMATRDPRSWTDPTVVAVVSRTGSEAPNDARGARLAAMSKMRLHYYEVALARLAAVSGLVIATAVLAGAVLTAASLRLQPTRGWQTALIV